MNDVCVIGGGPAGLAAAIALRMRGFTVTVRDARRPPIDKACGEGLLPAAFASLAELGIDAHSLPGVPLTGIRFSGHGVSVVGSFPGGEGRGVRRTFLHAALCDRAASCGVALQWNASVHSLDSLTERWIVGADGIQSRVRQWAGLDSVRRNSVRFGFQRHYQLAPWSNEVEVYWSERGQAYVTPIGPDEIGVAVLTRHRGLRIDDVLNAFPDLVRRLAGSGGKTRERGSATASRKLCRVTAGRVALVGDASGSVDAITGDGLALAFDQALLLASALEKGSLEAYGKRHASLSLRAFLMGDLMLGLDRFPAAQKYAMRALHILPGAFRTLVGIHSHHPRQSPTPSFLTCYR